MRTIKLCNVEMAQLTLFGNWWSGSLTELIWANWPDRSVLTEIIYTSEGGNHRLCEDFAGLLSSVLHWWFVN